MKNREKGQRANKGYGWARQGKEKGKIWQGKRHRAGQRAKYGRAKGTGQGTKGRAIQGKREPCIQSHSFESFIFRFNIDWSLRSLSWVGF
jgi:hypothetical protein